MVLKVFKKISLSLPKKNPHLISFEAFIRFVKSLIFKIPPAIQTIEKSLYFSFKLFIALKTAAMFVALESLIIIVSPLL